MLAGSVFYKTNLYKHKIVQEGLEYVHLTEDIQKEVEGIIETVKLTGNNEVKNFKMFFRLLLKKLLIRLTLMGSFLGTQNIHILKIPTMKCLLLTLVLN